MNYQLIDENETYDRNTIKSIISFLRPRAYLHFAYKLFSHTKNHIEENSTFSSCVNWFI